MSLSITKKNIYVFILYAIFLIPILFDLLYGFLNVFLNIDIPISSIYRIILIILVFPAVFKTRPNIVKNYIIILIIFFVASYFIWLLVYSNSYTLRELQQFIRILYPYIILNFLIFLYQQNKLHKSEIYLIMKLIVYSALIAALSIIYSFFSGYGLETYGDYSFATSSFFNAQNDITLSLILSINISMYLFLTYEKKYIIYSIIILISLVFLGTRAGLLGGIGTIFIYLFALLFMKKDVTLSLFSKITVFIVLSISLIIFVYEVFQLIMEYQYMIDKYLLIMEASPRAKLENAGYQVFYERNTWSNIIGQGSVPFCRLVENYYPSMVNYPYGKFVEEDILDILGSYGFFLGFIILFFPIYLFLKAITLFIRYRNIHSFFLLIGMSLFIAHSVLAGHAINSPTVASFITITYFMIIYFNQIESFR
jgi:hypothetical protein